MSILQKAVEVSATLDPTLGFELEQEYGADWQDTLAAAIKSAESAEVDEFDPKAGEPMKSDVEQLTQTDFKKKYKVKDIRVLADAIGVETRADGEYKREADLIADIYKAMK